MSTSRPIEYIVASFEKNGHRHYGEHVSELQHALQAATLARAHGESDPMVVSCLLHDFGHLCHDLGEDAADRGVDARHEELGAHLLRGLFPLEIVEAIRLHVAAKRYLCGQRAAYRDALSDASRLSLELQGGGMPPEEATEFEKHRFFDAALCVRHYDDMGKVRDMNTPDLESFLPVVSAALLDGP